MNRLHSTFEHATSITHSPMRPRRSARIMSLVMPGLSANGLRVTKITPVLGALVKVAPSKPTKATASLTPGRETMMSVACRTSASARSKAPDSSPPASEAE